MPKTKLILKEVLDNNPVRRGFLLDCHEDIRKMMSGESHEIRQLTCRLAYKIQELFELEDCEIVPIGVDPISGELSWALVRIVDQLQESPIKLQQNGDESDN